VKPLFGMVRHRFGQAYELLDWEGLTTMTGRPYRLCQVRSWCCDCGRPFTFRTTWTRFKHDDPGVRRCPDCAQPGKPSPGRVQHAQRVAEKAQRARQWATARDLAESVGGVTTADVHRYLFRNGPMPEGVNP
jgi:hypothetical protein